MGKHYDQTPIHDIIREGDMLQNNKISFDECKEVFSRTLA
jgi:hypothetical protein